MVHEYQPLNESGDILSVCSLFYFFKFLKTYKSKNCCGGNFCLFVFDSKSKVSKSTYLLASILNLHSV